MVGLFSVNAERPGVPSVMCVAGGGRSGWTEWSPEAAGPDDTVLARRLGDLRRELAACQSQNQRMAATLREARDQIVTLKAEVDRLAEPPSGYGVFLQANDDDTSTSQPPAADACGGQSRGRTRRTPARPGTHAQRALNVVGARAYERAGDIVMFKEKLDDERALVIGKTDDERVVRLAEPLREQKLRAGDSLLLDNRSVLCSNGSPRPRSRSWSSKRCRTSITPTSAVWPARSN